LLELEQLFHMVCLFFLSDVVPPVLHSCPTLRSSDLLDENGAIKSLKDVLESYVDSAIVLPTTYSFGTRVDDELASLAGDKKVTLSNQTFYTRFMDLFSAGKADFALIFPASIYTQYGKSMPVDVRSYPISGNPRFVSGHILCSDTHVGNEFIVRVNKGI